MSATIRRLVIYATVEGLVLHGHSSGDQHRSLRIEYGSQKITEIAKGHESHAQHAGRLEVSGLIGYGFVVIPITRREEVAKIFGKSIYLVSDVALLPLSSQKDASNSIRDVLSTQNASDDSDQSTSDDETAHIPERASVDLGSTPGDDFKPFYGKNPSSTSIAANVATRNVSFGSFASQWLTRQKKSSTDKPEGEEKDTSELKPASEGDPIADDIKKARESKVAQDEKSESTQKSQQQKYVATTGLLPRSRSLVLL